MPNGVGEGLFFLGKNNAGFIGCGFGKMAALCGGDGAFNMVVIKPTDKDGMRFDEACGDD